MLGTHHTATQSNTADARLQNRPNVVITDATDSNDRNIDISLFHLAYNLAVSFQPQDSGKILLGSGKAERSATDIVGTAIKMLPNLFESIGSATDNILFAQYPSRFVYFHIMLPQVHTIGMNLFDQLHMIVYNKCGITHPAHRLYLSSGIDNLLIRSIFHTQLNPAASSFESHQRTINIRISIVELSNKLNGCHGVDIF